MTVLTAIAVIFLSHDKPVRTILVLISSDEKTGSDRVCDLSQVKQVE